MQALETRIEEWVPAWATELLASNTFYAITAMSLLFIAFAICRIFAKAGYPGWLGVFVWIPIVNVMVLLGLAFLRWPVESELRALRKVERAMHRAEVKRLRRAA